MASVLRVLICECVRTAGTEVSVDVSFYINTCDRVHEVDPFAIRSVAQLKPHHIKAENGRSSAKTVNTARRFSHRIRNAYRYL